MVLELVPCGSPHISQRNALAQTNRINRANRGYAVISAAQDTQNSHPVKGPSGAGTLRRIEARAASSTALQQQQVPNSLPNFSLFFQYN